MSDTTQYRFTLLESKFHNRTAFSCNEPSLDEYLKKRASQDVKKQVAVVYVMTTEDAPTTILGYYTLTASSINSNDIPESIRKTLPRYNQVGITLMGRLAIDFKFQGQGIGSTLLMDALHRSLQVSKEVASFALVVDALHEQAKNFYLHYGFTAFEEYPLKLFLPMKTIARELNK